MTQEEIYTKALANLAQAKLYFEQGEFKQEAHAVKLLLLTLSTERKQKASA
jgi:hypothetical protein